MVYAVRAGHGSYRTMPRQPKSPGGPLALPAYLDLALPGHRPDTRSSASPGQPTLATEAATRMRRLLANHARGGRLARYSIYRLATQAGTVEDLAWTLAALAALHAEDGSAQWTPAAPTAGG